MHIVPQSSSAFIYDNHRLFAQSFAGFLERLSIFQQVRNTSNETEAVRTLVALATEGPVYFFLDYQVGTNTSVDLFNDARRISKKIKIVVVTDITRPATIAGIRAYGPDAMISKLSGTDVITECLGAIARKQQYVCPVIANQVSAFDITKNTNRAFSRREIEILNFFDQGLTIVEAAGEAHLSRYTIVNHRSNMMKKSGTKSIVELLAYARRNDIL